MPLIVLTGFPSSGKSTMAAQLKEFFINKGKKVHIVSENVAVPKAGFQKNEFFADSQKEKMIRSDLKSDIVRSLNKEDVSILDAGNYIKGYRYELFCATKAARVNQCTIFCAISKNQAQEFNKKRKATKQDLTMSNDNELNNSYIAYTDEIFEQLIGRYEEPQANNRWDSPLFVAHPDDQVEIDFEHIYKLLYENKPPPPNQSTQNPPLRNTNYLFELDNVTKNIIQTIVAARKYDVLGAVPIEQHSVGNSELFVRIPSDLDATQLNRLRRQFLNYSKMHPNIDLEKAPQLFVQFLNSNYNK